MHYLNLQEGKRRGHKIAVLLDLVGTKMEKKFIRTRTVCSCALCGNRRHWEKERIRRLTVQERRAPREDDY